jgi:hypothetical protein
VKSMTFLYLILGSFLLVACDADDAIDPKLENQWSPVTCAKDASANGCETEWNFYFKRDGFPANVAIYVNKVKLIDECSPDGRWTTRSSGAKVEFQMDNYSSIKKTDKISLRVMDLGQPCGSKNEEHLYHATQNFEVTNNDTDNYVVIEN